jgi:hypothetical protein
MLTLVKIVGTHETGHKLVIFREPDKAEWSINLMRQCGYKNIRSFKPRKLGKGPSWVVS